MSRLRLLTWNCRSGSVGARLSEVAEFDPHVVFLQEWGRIDGVHNQLVCSHMNGRKGIALLAPTAAPRAVAVSLHNCGQAAISARFLASEPFTVVGIWARGPNYVEDVLLTVRRCSPLSRRGPTVIMGDLNTGSRLGRRASVTTNHRRVLDICTSLDLVSAYHAFHRLEPSFESDATYFHQFKRSKPWHIDYCFVPRAWASRLTKVEVIDGRKWAKRSDHRPLLVEVESEPNAVTLHFNNLPEGVGPRAGGFRCWP